MTMKDQRIAEYSTRLVALSEAGKIGLNAQGPYGYRITSGPFVVDYWPGRGTWRTPTGSRQDKGWDSLLKYLEVREDEQNTPVNRGSDVT